MQRPLGELFFEAPAREPLPYLEYLNSDLNSSLIKTEVSPGGGKLRRVQARWIQRLPESIAVEGADIKNCTATEEYGDSTETYELSTTDTIQVSQKIDAETIATHCQDNSRYVVESIARLANALERAVATKAATETAALIGAWGTEVEDFFTVTDNKLEIATLLSSGDIAPSVCNANYGWLLRSVWHRLVGCTCSIRFCFCIRSASCNCIGWSD